MEKQNVRINEKLGAKVFKTCVFMIENLKFVITQNFFPSSRERCEKRWDKIAHKKCGKANTEEEKKHIIQYYRNKKLALRREFARKENRNYHIDADDPIRFLKYLNWNKRIHKKGLIVNCIIIPAAITGIVLTSGLIKAIATSILIWNSIGLAINFECINLQNYNIKRIENQRETLERISERNRQRNIQQYGEASQVIALAFSKTDQIPIPEEIATEIKTEEQLLQMRALIARTIAGNNGIVKKR